MVKAFFCYYECVNNVLQLCGDKVFYDYNGENFLIKDNVISLWREDRDIYYNSNNVLCTYNFDTKEEKKMVNEPHTILGKYKDYIISYSGRNIYAIKGTEKTKVFKDGYYLNSAVLYNNKVYGIPATNVYEYNLDTLEVNRVTTWHDLSKIFMVSDEMYIRIKVMMKLIMNIISLIMGN